LWSGGGWQPVGQAFPITGVAPGRYQLSIEGAGGDDPDGYYETLLTDPFTVASDAQTVLPGPITLTGYREYSYESWPAPEDGPEIVELGSGIQVGEAVSVDPGDWGTSLGSEQLRFQWFRNGKLIPGGDTQIYVIAPGD